MNLRDALRIAWEDGVVEGYPMACHLQIVRLRDVLADVAGSPRLPHDLPAWLSDLQERMGWAGAAPCPLQPRRLDDVLNHGAAAPMRPLERAAWLQAAVGARVQDASTSALAADLLASRALSSGHALPVCRRAARRQARAAVASFRSVDPGGAGEMAERVLSAVSALHAACSVSG